MCCHVLNLCTQDIFKSIETFFFLLSKLLIKESSTINERIDQILQVQWQEAQKICY